MVNSRLVRASHLTFTFVDEETCENFATKFVLPELPGSLHVHFPETNRVDPEKLHVFEYVSVICVHSCLLDSVSRCQVFFFQRAEVFREDELGAPLFEHASIRSFIPVQNQVDFKCLQVFTRFDAVRVSDDSVVNDI